jgi:hypothetical protein
MEEWQPPLVEVNAAVDTAFKTYKVGAFYADPARGWQTSVNEWEAKYGGLLVKAPNGKQMKVKNDNPFEWWMTGGRSEYIQRAVEAFHTAVVNKEQSHGPHQAFTNHVLNARLRVVHTKRTIGKEHDYSPKKIDLCVCAFLAWQGRLDCVAAGIGTAPTTGRLIRVR